MSARSLAQECSQKLYLLQPKNWKISKCSFTQEMTNRLLFIPTMGYVSAMERNKPLMKVRQKRSRMYHAKWKELTQKTIQSIICIYKNSRKGKKQLRYCQEPGLGGGDWLKRGLRGHENVWNVFFYFVLFLFCFFGLHLQHVNFPG